VAVQNASDEGTAAEPPVVKKAYATKLGAMYQAKVEDFLKSPDARKYKGKIQLIFTSPPFPLVTQKTYGNKVGEEYLEWLSDLAPKLAKLLTPTGSIVIELGNAWEKGHPVMSTLPLKSLLKFQEAGKLFVNQQFICHNPARLPSPVQWVTRERIRVKDSYTHVWWMSPTERPKADNRKVLVPYSTAMKKLMEKGSYNSAGWRHYDAVLLAMEQNGIAMADRHEAVKDEQSPVREAILLLHAASTLTIGEIAVLLRGGYVTGAGARWRSLHELVVTAHLVVKGGASIARRYLDHGYVTRVRRLEEFYKQPHPLAPSV
jgi:hypothetical protein